MLRGTFFWRLYLGYVLLIILSTALVGILVARQIEEGSLREIEDSLRAQAAALSELAHSQLVVTPAEPAHAELQRWVSRMARGGETRFTVVLPDGRVVADTMEDPLRMGDHSGRPELRDARLTGIGRSTRYSRTLGVRMMYVALPIRDGDRLLGLARTSLPLTLLEERRGRLRETVLLSATIAAVVALLGGLYFARRITRPLSQMTEAVRSLANGESRHRVPVEASDEVGTLARAFNSMEEELERRLETITGDRNKILAILSAMKEGVIAVDQDEQVVHMNDAAGRMFGVDPRVAIGRRVWEVVRVTAVGEAIGRTIRESRPQTLEVRIPASGSDQVMEVQSSVLSGAEGQLAGAVLVMHDVTELRRLENMRREFVSNVSHELKTPLAAIRGLVESILDDPGMESETRRRFLGKVHRQSQRLNTLVSDLLSLSRVERQNGSVERVRLDLRAPVRESIEAQQSAAEEKGLTLAQELSPEPVFVLAEHEALRQVFDNLLSNAIRYTPEGGRIRVRLREAGGLALAEVEDTGIGIDPVHQDRIFERFYRVDKARSRELGGTGLGLAIVKHVVQGFGGAITLDSTPGRGSVFHLKLPLAGSEDA